MFLRVGGRSGWVEVWGMPWMDRPLVQISVVVAIIEARTFKVEVGKGSPGTAVVWGLADPKQRGNSITIRIRASLRKGSR